MSNWHISVWTLGNTVLLTDQWRRYGHQPVQLKPGHSYVTERVKCLFNDYINISSWTLTIRAVLQRQFGSWWATVQRNVGHKVSNVRVYFENANPIPAKEHLVKTFIRCYSITSLVFIKPNPPGVGLLCVTLNTSDAIWLMVSSPLEQSAKAWRDKLALCTSVQYLLVLRHTPDKAGNDPSPCMWGAWYSLYIYMKIIWQKGGLCILIFCREAFA